MAAVLLCWFSFKLNGTSTDKVRSPLYKLWDHSGYTRIGEFEYKSTSDQDVFRLEIWKKHKVYLGKLTVVNKTRRFDVLLPYIYCETVSGQTALALRRIQFNNSKRSSSKGSTEKNSEDKFFYYQFNGEQIEDKLKGELTEQILQNKKVIATKSKDVVFLRISKLQPEKTRPSFHIEWLNYQVDSLRLSLKNYNKPYQFCNEKGKYQFINPVTEKPINSHQYDCLTGDFSEGLASVCKGRKFGIINEKGKYIIKLSGKLHLPGDFHEGLASVSLAGNTRGFINKKGEIVIKLKNCGYVRDFSEGFAAASINGKIGYVNRKGTLVIPNKFDLGNNFKNGKAFVIINDKHAYIDKTGKYISGPEFPPKAKFTYTMRIKYNLVKNQKIVEDKWSFILRHLGINKEFKTLPEFKNHLKTLPPHSVIEWAPGCCVSGDEPLESDSEMDDFENFCKENKIKLIIHPSG